MRTLLIAVLLASTSLPAQNPAASRSIISVGPNVQISKAFPNLAHYENLAAGDPDHVGRLVACATVAHQDLGGQDDHCYVSFDNGKTWKTVLEFDEGPRNSDPTMTYGRGDTVFIVNEYIPSPGFGAMTAPGMEQNRIDVYRSPDGGKTWARSATFPFIDRESIVVDETDGKYAGRIYINGVTKGYFAPGGPSNALLFRSLDGGSTFIGPTERPTTEGNLLGASNVVLFSDGTVAFATIHVKKDRNENVSDENNPRTANAELQLISSSDGGESFNPWTTIGDWWLDMNSAQGAEIAMLAVDPGSRFFKDRAYAVWPSAPSGRIDIFVAHSDDKGKTWSAPLRVNDDRPPASRDIGPDHIMPAIGVNKQGVILVTWFDRRDAGDNTGWKVRTAASLDGGVTFSPSTVVSEAANTYTDRTRVMLNAPGVSGGGTRRPGAARGRPISVNLGVNGFFLSGGDTDGIAVGADDVFHAIWVDNRTGVSQFWTAPVTVRGTVEKHGARELADLDDVTDKLTVDVRATNYDRLTGTLTLSARLKNTSKDVVRAPLKARVINLSSQLAVPTIVGAANGVSGVGAIWDWSDAIPAGGLLPDSLSSARTLRFHLSDLRPIRRPRQPGGGLSGLVRFDTRIYGARGTSDKAAP